MFVELIELLRCPNAHADTHLVVTATRTEARHIRDGMLGCPACGAEFDIQDGVGRFGAPSWRGRDEPASAALAMRLAAFLDLTDSGGYTLLFGRHAAQADQLQRLTTAPVVLLNPSPSALRFEVAAALEVAEALPFAAGSIRAAAFDENMPAALVAAAVRALRPRGRLVGAATMPVPDGMTEMVRDDDNWIAERTATPTPGLVSIGRRRQDFEDPSSR